MKRYLAYRAGPQVLNIIREEGLAPRRIKVFAAAAGGPKWFVCVGFDTAVIRTGFLQKGDGRVLLVGSSAGAWRCLTIACRDPLEAYERLRLGYSRSAFTAADTPETVSAAFRGNVDRFLFDDQINYILDHPTYDLGIQTVRSRGPAALKSGNWQFAALLVSAAMNAVSPRGMELFYERVVFYSGRSRPQYLDNSFRGRSVKLTNENIRQAALATGSLPYIMAGVPDIPGAPRGVYRDGGLIDYQLNQDYCPGPESVTLFFHYQERIVPSWLDKKLTWRRPTRGSLDNVLQVYPTEEFLRLLPDGRLPDRQDFVDFVDDPGERIRRWDEASEKSAALGEQFMEDWESGRIGDLVRPFPD
ncbi:MAG: patatin-like phospholipase family protein [Deltaproteobacteria bacterium]|nr:patatin-like phospholipase family protein [Deltaproteobacteria bacterium]